MAQILQADRKSFLIMKPVSVLLVTLFIFHCTCAENANIDAGEQFKSILGFQVSSGVSIAQIQQRLGPAKSFAPSEFEKAICYYREQTMVTLISQGDDDAHAVDTFDVYEVSTLPAGLGTDMKKVCSMLPGKIPNIAFQPGGLKLGMSIDQFEALTGAAAADEMHNGVKSIRVFQKFFSTSHSIYAAFNSTGLVNFRVQ